MLLAILAFSLSLLGTFLVRSGVLTSVHAFATDPRARHLHPRVPRRGGLVAHAVRVARAQGRPGRALRVSDLAHPDFLFDCVVGERDGRVDGEFQVIIESAVDAAG